MLGLLKYNLDIRLAGNRAPFCFGTHSQYYLENWVAANAPQVTVAEMRQTITDFLDYARSKPEVRIVSGQQIVDWMRNPVAIDDRPAVVNPVPTAGDEVTINRPRITLGNLFVGCVVETKVNDGPWTQIQVNANGVAFLPGLRQGTNDAAFRQVARDGTASTVQPVRIQFDSIAPQAPRVTLLRHVSRGLTRDPALSLNRVETGARIEYSVNGGTWSTTYAPIEGRNVDRVRAVDSAGNFSHVRNGVRFTLDRTVVPVSVTLLNDTMTPGDRITRDGRLRLSGIEDGARVQWSADGGRTWVASFAAGRGANNLLVRQRDRAGNVSAATAYSFTLVGR